MNIKAVPESTARGVLLIFGYLTSGKTFPPLNRRKTAKPVVRCEKCKASFYWQAKCPSCGRPRTDHSARSISSVLAIRLRPHSELQTHIS